jgi:hypothetical protein
MSLQDLIDQVQISISYFPNLFLKQNYIGTGANPTTSWIGIELTELGTLQLINDYSKATSTNKNPGGYDNELWRDRTLQVNNNSVRATANILAIANDVINTTCLPKINLAIANINSSTYENLLSISANMGNISNTLNYIYGALLTLAASVNDTNGTADRTLRILCSNAANLVTNAAVRAANISKLTADYANVLQYKLINDYIGNQDYQNSRFQNKDIAILALSGVAVVTSITVLSILIKNQSDKSKKLK